MTVLPAHPLTFARLREANVERCSGTFHPLGSWSPNDWATALAGEVGEACNLLKKARRGEPIERAAVAHELADAVIYLDLLAARLGIDLGTAVAHKFNAVSNRRGSPVMIHPAPGIPCPLGAMDANGDGVAVTPLSEWPTLSAPEGT